MSKNVKIISLCLAFGLIMSTAVNMIKFGGVCDRVRDDVFRLHILANSDSAADQALKLKVRDGVLTAFSEYSPSSLSDAVDTARQNIDKLRETAKKILRKNGCDDAVDAKIEQAYFDTRTYGDVTLPAGEYTALRIVIGNGEGHNWWCVMYPSLCLPAATNLDDALDESEQDVVENYPKYRIKFKIVEWFEQIKSWFYSI